MTHKWCERRGWRAVFGLAAVLPSGRPSGGVALLFRQSDTLGITDPGLSAGDLGHRLLAVRMVVDGYEPCLVAVAYFEVGVGLNEINRTILSTLAQWQETVQLPAIIGADFNFAPKVLVESTYVVRSGLCPAAPRPIVPPRRTRPSTTSSWPPASRSGS